MIVLNLIVLCVDYHHASQNYIEFLARINIFFVILFTFEAAAKITGLGIEYYFRRSDNIFDFFIVISSVIALYFDIHEKEHGTNKKLNADGAVNVTVLRLIRVIRLKRLAKSSQSMKWLLKTMELSFLNIMNTMLLYSLLIFVFTLTGMDLFGKITLGK